MLHKPIADPDCFARRWVACFDWLGFSRFIYSHEDWIKPYIEYSSIIDRIDPNAKRYNIKTTWFSDTYIFYTDDDSFEAYGKLKVFATDFIDHALKQDIPMCGAMSSGELYADEKGNVFFGKALIDAYSYTENQDWIGFVLCPSAIKRIEEIKSEKGTKAEIYDRLDFQYWEIPLKKSRDKSDHTFENNLLAYRLGRALGGHGTREGCIFILERLRNKAEKDEYRVKYQRTIDFLQKTKTVSG